MIPYILICLVLIIAALEVISLKVDPDKVFFRCDLDMDLTEPDEIATLSYRVSNAAKWPLMFVSFSFTFNEAIDVRESEEWLSRHGSDSLFNKSYTIDTFLLAHKTYKGKIRISVKKRGKYDIGKVYIETGDFLGFKTRASSFALDKSIVCTARFCEDESVVEAVGGTLGDISVRRFIMEDPSLVLGYREYTGSEPLKSISWIQTAKTGRIMVKKHDFTVDNDVAVFVDIEHTEPAVAERCFSLVRTACDMLEDLQIPYALYSNGDLFNTEKGSGRTHLFELHRRIGVASFIKYSPFAATARRNVKAGSGQTGCILIAPEFTPEVEYVNKLIQENSGAKACVLIGKEEAV